jgi:glycosyltransferase involved in cell wall biosynthesis
MIRHVEDLAEELDMVNGFFVLGQLNGAAKNEVFERASIFALPTFEDEGLPVSVLEAMSAGCRLLTTSVGGMAGVLTDRVNGVIMASISLKSIREGLDSLVGDDELRTRCQRNCQKKAWEDCTSSVVFGRFQACSMSCRNDRIKRRP